MRLASRLVCVIGAILAGSCATTSPSRAPATEPFVIAANPLAAEAGIEVLRRGGRAIDAAIAVQAMLSLVEPQSSGVGGGAFLTYYDASTMRVGVYDGRETAPAQASQSMFLGPDGKPVPFRSAVLSGRATGVPGVLAALKLAHVDHGGLDWSTLFRTAERTAEEGFVVSPRLERMVHANHPQNKAPDVQAYFRQGSGGRLVRAGDRMKNPAYADFLRRLARDGIGALYAGTTAAKIVERTRQGPLPGQMTSLDLAGYKAVKREALCTTVRIYIACVPPPPSSGVGLLELLLLLEKTDIAKRGPDDAQAWFLFAEASRLMYADRDRYIGDPAFVRVPTVGLIEDSYIARRARLIGSVAGPPPVPGEPARAGVAGADSTLEPAGTSHFIVGDAAGNAVSMTTTVESIFGSGRMVDGFFLNNQMTDFAFSPRDAEGRPAANAVAPGKRPRSSMAPLILLHRDGRLAGAFGSPGGNAILAYIAKTMVAAIDWRMPVQQAIAAPNLVARGANFQGEVSKFAPSVIGGLRARGIELKPGQGEDSGVHGVMVRDGRVDGGADPRREGVVLTLPPAR